MAQVVDDDAAALGANLSPLLGRGATNFVLDDIEPGNVNAASKIPISAGAKFPSFGLVISR